MAKQELKTVLTIVQDETGSMMSIADQTISAFNEYFDSLKKDDGIGKVEVLALQFSDPQGFGDEDTVRVLHRGALKKVPKLTHENYRPRGVTPLLDAVGTAVTETEKKKADRYLFIVQTDGLENASHEYTREQIAKIMGEKEKADNWTLVFLGAGLNNWVQEAARMGVARTGQTVSYDPDDQAVAYASLAGSTRTFLQTNSVKAQSMGAATEEEIERRKKTKK